MSQYKFRSYKIKPKCNKSTYQKECWENKLKNGRDICLHVTTLFRWGTFEIRLTKQQKKDILKKQDIILNDYEYTVETMYDGCDIYVEIQNQDTYSPEEIKEINNLIYYTNNHDSFEEDMLESNRWYLDDTIYGFTRGCTVENK